MKHIASRITAFLFIYLCLIFGIFVVQFTKGKTFSFSMAAMSVSGRHEINEQGENIPLLPLHIVFKGLNFYITDQSPIIAEKKDGNTISLKVLSYTNSGNSFTINCSEGIIIKFTADKSGFTDSVLIKAVLPEDTENIAFPWKLTQMARLERHDGKMLLRYGKQKFAFSEGAGFENPNTSAEIPRLFLSAENPSAYYHTYIPSKGIVLESLASNPLASEEKYAEVKKTFSEAAFAYFKNAVESKVFSEKVATAYIAELGRKGLYGNALQTAPASLLPKNRRSYLSLPFYGNMAENYAEFSNKDKHKKAFIEKKISEKSFEVFTLCSILPFIVNRNCRNLIGGIAEIALSADLETLTPLQAAGILEASMDYPIYFSEIGSNVFYNMTETCLNRIKDALLVIEDGLFITTDEDNKVSTIETLYISRVLIRYAEENAENNVWKFVGHMLLTSLFGVSGEAGGMPSGFTVTSGASLEYGLMVDDEKILYPEDLYPEVIETSWYPHEKALITNEEKGCWAWTSAENLEVTENSSKVFAFKVKFAENRTHHLVINGIPPFYAISIHGLTFRSDPRFEIYPSSGYIYNANTKTLFLKLKHKQTYEEVRLSLGQPPAPAKPKPVPVITKPAEIESVPSTSTITNKKETN